MRNRYRHRRKNQFRRALQNESLEQRVLLAYDLAHSLFPDPTGPQEDVGFGYSTAVSSEYRIVGAPFASIDGNGSVGEAYIYDASGDLTATLKNPTPAVGDNFGFSVAASGDIVVVWR